VSERSEDRESESKRNLPFGRSWVRCDRQAQIAMSSAVNMDAILRMRWAINEPLVNGIFDILLQA